MQGPIHPGPHSYPHAPGPPAPGGASNMRLILGIVGAVCGVLVLAGAILGYVSHERKLDRQANAWSVAVEGGDVDDYVTLDIEQTPLGAKVGVLGKEVSCDFLCRVKLDRSSVKAGETEIIVALDWKKRHVEKRVSRKPFAARVKLTSPGGKRSQVCTVLGAPSLTFLDVVFEKGVTVHAQGAAGDEVSVDGKASRPGDGKDYTVSLDDLLGRLVLGTESAGVRRVEIAVPLEVRSIDREGWKGSISCSADELRHRVLSDLRDGKLKSRAAASGKAAALLITDKGMFYGGEGSSPWEATIIATVNAQNILQRDCTYGEFLSSYVFYYWYAHQVTAADLRTGAARGEKRFAPNIGAWECPHSQTFATAETSKREEIGPSEDTELAWLKGLASR